MYVYTRRNMHTRGQSCWRSLGFFFCYSTTLFSFLPARNVWDFFLVTVFFLYTICLFFFAVPVVFDFFLLKPLLIGQLLHTTAAINASGNRLPCCFNYAIIGPFPPTIAHSHGGDNHVAGRVFYSFCMTRKPSDTRVMRPWSDRRSNR